MSYSNTDRRVAHYLRQMKKAMPEIKRQIKTYEKNVKAGTVNKTPATAPQFKND